jgi:hypothetical protein
MSMVYKMVQIPPNISVSDRDQHGNAAAAYLEGVVNQLAAQGWEFLRIDTIGVHVQPGCLLSLLGQKTSVTSYYVVTFRKQA